MLNKLLVVAGVIILLSAIVTPSFVNATPLTTLWCRSVLHGAAIPGPTVPFCDLLGLGEVANIATTFNTAICPTGYVQTSAAQCTLISNVLKPGTVLPSNNYPPPRILSHSAYTSSTGSLHIVGEVINQSPVTAKFVKIIVTFYNAYNQVMGTDFTYTQPSDLAPGQRASFDILVLSGGIPMNQVRNYVLTVDAS
jgi:hypothetical protein